MERLKLGRISYVNTLPLFYEILRSSQASFQLFSGVPSEINRAFVEGQLDAALISTFTYLKHKNFCDLVPTYCLASDGTVDSVSLFSTRPIEQLNGSTIGLTTSSATSQMILKILLERYLGFHIHWQEMAPSVSRSKWQESFDAILLIGDDALSLSKDTTPFCYDLGELWKQKTGAPILFAVLAKQKSVSGKSVEPVNAWFQKSLRVFEEHPEALIEFAKTHSSLKINYREYFSKLQFVFTDASRHALSVYENHLLEMGAV